MFCENCDREIHEDDIVYQEEDFTNTVPFGDTYLDIDGIILVGFCPICDEELTE